MSLSAGSVPKTMRCSGNCCRRIMPSPERHLLLLLPIPSIIPMGSGSENIWLQRTSSFRPTGPTCWKACLRTVWGGNGPRISFLCLSIRDTDRKKCASSRKRSKNTDPANGRIFYSPEQLYVENSSSSLVEVGPGSFPGGICMTLSIRISP